MTRGEAIILIAVVVANVGLSLGPLIVRVLRSRRLIRELSADVATRPETADHLPSVVTAKTRALVRARAHRLVRVLDLDAPDFIVAWEAALVGDAAWLLCPMAVADRLQVQHAAEARRYAGVCAEAPCEAAAVEDGMCAEHAAKLRSDVDDVEVS